MDATPLSNTRSPKRRFALKHFTLHAFESSLIPGLSHLEIEECATCNPWIRLESRMV